MQSNENPETTDSLKMDDDARATITGPQSTEMEDNSTATTITAAAVADDVPDEDESTATTAVPAIETTVSTGDSDGDMMPPPPLAMEPRPPSSAASDKDDEEGLSLQELSGRSSTPYTVQSVCCDNANCELGSTSSSTVSPVKEESPEDGLDLDRHKDDLVTEVGQRAEDDIEGRKYTRSDLMNIRDCMTIVRPECLGALRLKRLHFLKSENVTNGLGNANGNKNKSYRTSNPQNDLMPAFFKRKTALSNGSANSITYDTFKYTDSHAFGNRSESATANIHRRIGSGRISNREVNWDYIPEEDPEKDNLPEFFNTKDTTTGNGKLQQQRHTKKYDLDDNSNYVKRVINSVVGESSTSFRSGISKASNHSVGDDHRHSGSNGVTAGGPINKSDEPEWFSCGPTSRLDTIELCGFNESDQQEIRMEMAKVKNKPDLNNNSEDPKANGGHKDKKHLAFQFDEFSTHSGKNAGNSNNASGNRMPGSKFLPLFNAKKREDEKPTKDINASQLLNDFFKRSDLPAAHKEKMSLSEIPSVDEIEAKCRIQQQQQKESKPKAASRNFYSNAEQFKKMLSQLNQHQPGGIPLPTTSQQPAPPPPQSQPSVNLFNNDNLSNFIKQRNLQQQLLQKQQQAAFAQFQLNSILNRPEAQMLLLSLGRGEISKQGLIVQLSNPNLTQADREAITAVLTFSAAGQYQQQLAINTSQHQQFITNQLQHLALLQQQISKNTAAKRNLGANGFQPNPVGATNPRTYSQEELQSHANLILHNAMMKKRIEEQTNLGVQKILQMQNSVLNNGYIGGNSRTNDTLAGSKNQAQQQQQQLNRNRKGGSSNAANRGNNLARRRSTSSTSSSNTGINTTHMKLASDLEYRQLEQRRNTIATTNATVMRIRRPRNITRTQFMIVTAVGFLGGVYIWQPLLLKWKRETESALAVADQPKLDTGTAK